MSGLWGGQGWMRALGIATRAWGRRRWPLCPQHHWPHGAGLGHFARVIQSESDCWCGYLADLLQLLG